MGVITDEGRKEAILQKSGRRGHISAWQTSKRIFYSERRKKDDDAHPIDFVKDFDKWKDERPPETEWIKKMVKRANKEIMHLTYKRHYGTPNGKEWGFWTNFN